MPDQVIPYRDADYRQFTRIGASAEAQGFFAEIVTPGWDPGDQPFTYAGLHLRTEVRDEAGSGCVCVDNLRLRPAAIGRRLHGLGYLEGASHLGSALILGHHADDGYVAAVRSIVEGYRTIKAGVTRGERHGVSWVIVRALADSTDELQRLILDVNAFDRSVTTGQGRLDLRRY